MVIAELSFMPLGRFQVKLDYSIEEVLYLPGVQDAEITALEQCLRGKDYPDTSYRDVVLSALASTYLAEAREVEFHFVADRQLSYEPEQDNDPNT